MIMGRESILTLSPRLIQEAIEFSIRAKLSALEHHVFKEVRESGAASLLITRANSKPSLPGEGGRGVVFEDQQLQPIRKSPTVDTLVR